MEKNPNKAVKKQKGYSIFKLDLSNNNITRLESLISLNITELYISNNKLKEVPEIILGLKNIRVLDLSFNHIEYFDSSPNFCENIEYLNLSNNKLLGPPYWVWASNPKKIVEINVSSNSQITQAFQNGYFEELLHYKCLVKNIIIYNCKLKNHSQLLGTFPKAKKLEFGQFNMSTLSDTNKTDNVLWKVLESSSDIERINLCNTGVYAIAPTIGMYTNLKEIDLSYNEISKLPEEFCNMKTLEVCILSHNYIMYLPEKLYMLENLMTLAVDNNELCLLPDYICKFPCLTKLDLYNNFLYEVPNEIETFLEIDLAMNYFEEPCDEEYAKKREKIRLNHKDRYDGRKNLEEKPDSEHSDSLTDEHLTDELAVSDASENKDCEHQPPSSPEDWDSDEYWVPHLTQKHDSPQSPWIFFVKQKMNEGNFCPIDAHIVPIADQVKYEKLCNPTIEYETDGQYDDLSDENS